MLRLIFFPIKLMFAVLLIAFLVQTGLLVKGVTYAWMLAVGAAPLMLIGSIYMKWSRGYPVLSFGTLSWCFMTGLFIGTYIL